MNTMGNVDAQPEGGGPPLRLRLTHIGGEARSVAVRMPAVGIGVADALAEAGIQPADAQWRLANLCRIRWSAAAQRWQLHNLSYTLMCALNGQRVAAAHPLYVAAGDVLELGLLRFVVELESGATAEDATIGVARAPAPGEALPAISARGFDLRDLAVDAEDSGQVSSQVDAIAAAFAMLQIAGMQPLSTADVLSGLLGESRRPEARSEPAAHSQLSVAVVQGAGVSLFDELHDEFVRVVRDPDQLAGLVGWDHPLVAGGEPAPTLNQLQKQAEHFPLLRDILQPREGIDRIIEGFEALTRSRLLDPAAPEDVLGLFAPELVRDASASLPSLTRREHHELSPDSHVRIGRPRVRPGEHEIPDSDKNEAA
jgi:hypothetical protein